MKKRGLSAFFALLAACFAAAALSCAIFCRGRVPVLAGVPDAAAELTASLMDALCRGDFEEAQTMLYGDPDLGAGGVPGETAGAMIWDAYLQSLDYQLVGELYPTQRGLCQDVKIIHMELDSVTKNLNTRARTLLDEAVASAQTVEEVYDETNAYREDLVMDILEQAVAQALEEDARYTYRILPLQLVWEEGRWFAVADRAFLDAVSGGITLWGSEE